MLLRTSAVGFPTGFSEPARSARHHSTKVRPAPSESDSLHAFPSLLNARENQLHQLLTVRPYCVPSSFRHQGNKVKNTDSQKCLSTHSPTGNDGTSTCLCQNQTSFLDECGPCAGVCVWRSMCTWEPRKCVGTQRPLLP